jgi:hypothetical protein
METEKVKLTQLRCNADNPRRIEKAKFECLVDSILVLPKMLELRPVVVDKRMVAYGGNMRTKALQTIARMSPEGLAERLSTLSDFMYMTKGERDVLLEWWGTWLEAPFAFIVRATDLTPDELRQFMIKDNASFGSWDWDKLANEFDTDRLPDWGLDVWPDMPDDEASEDGEAEAEQEEDEDGDVGEASTDAEDTGKVTIVFPKDREDEVAALLGLASIDKRKYLLDELLQSKGG